MKFVPLLGALVLLPFVTSESHAATIGINFATGRSAGQVESLSVGAIVGVVPQGNWNNVTGNVGSLANVIGPTAGLLVDDSGLSTALSLSFSSTNSWGTAASALTGDAELLNGYLDNTNATTPTSITLSGIPYAAYDIYLYLGSDSNGRTGHATLTGGASVYFTTAASPFDGAYTAATGTAVADANLAEYVKYGALSGASQTLTITKDTNNVGVYGVQVVQVPEPASAALLCGTIGLLALRRRR